MPICSLVLAGLLATNSAPSAPRPARESIEVKVLSVRLTDSQAPMAAGGGPNALTNPRTGTTCTMMILAATPVIDAGIFAPGGAGPVVDLITNNSLSPCVAGPETPGR